MKVRNVLFAVLFLLCTVPAILIHTPMAYVPLTFLLLLSAVSMLYTVLTACSCVLLAETEERRRYKRESAANYSVTIHNRSPLPVPRVMLFLRVESSEGFSPRSSAHMLMLRPWEKLTLELPLVFSHIGRYEVKVSRLRFYGLLGVFSVSRRPSWSVPVQITPKLYELPDFEIQTSRPTFEVNFSVPYQTDGGEYADIRQYVPGDPIKNIHWKLSAHTAEYINRIFRTDAVSGVSVYLDFRFPARLPEEERAAVCDCLTESAYAAAMHAQERSYSVEFLYAQGSVPCLVRPADREKLEETVYALPPVSASERYPLELLLKEFSGRMGSFDHIFVLTAQVSRALIELLSVCRQRGKYPVLLHVYGEEQPSLAGRPAAELVSGRGIEYHAVRSGEQLAATLKESL